MTFSWWQMPGPGRYVSFVSSDIRNGLNVVLCLPGGTETDIMSAIRQEFMPDEIYFSVLPLDAGSVEVDPLDILFDRFAPTVPKDLTRTPLSLCEQESFLGQIIILAGITEELWPAWKSFLEEYEQACRTLSPLDRTVFITILIGPIAQDPPSPEVMLSVRHYDGYIEKNDMLLYAASIYSFHSGEPVKKQLCISICAELSLWDPELCKYLARLDSRQLLDPGKILREFAEERNWSNILDIQDRNHLWASGALQKIEGRDILHSSLLAIQSSERELNQRIWRAELTILYPLIEQKRQQLIQELSSSLQLPHVTQYGESIKDPLDLEIGHIYAQLQNNWSHYLGRYRRQIALLRDIRNALAHLEPVEKELLMDLTFLQ
jgi:hypothetical protein